MEFELWTLGIGGAMLVGVVSYAWASSRHAAQRRRNLDRGESIDSREFIDQMLQGEAAKAAQANNGKNKKDKRRKGVRKRAGEQQEPSMGGVSETAAKTNTGHGAPRQASLIDNNVDHNNKNNKPQGDSDREIESMAGLAQQSQLVLVYVMARSGGEFRCSGVNRMLTRAGCSLDERGVFNLKDKDHKPSFSVVNAHEPATFDRERLDITTTRGLAFFFESRGSGDKNRFDSLMNTARRLSMELDGDLLDEKRQPFSTVREQRYRSDLAE